MAGKKEKGFAEPKHLRASKSQGRSVARMKSSNPNISVGRPDKIRMAAMKMGSTGGGYGGGSNWTDSLYGNYYSPELSTDFLELPQADQEKRQVYRFFYRSQPFVRQALDLHTELPLSKVRLATPPSQNRELALRATRFCERWARRVGLLRRLIEIVHEYHLIGEVFIWAEDDNPEMPADVRTETIRTLGENGLSVEERERPDADERAVEWLKENYHGWTDIRVLPPETVHMEGFEFTKEKLFELVPSSQSKGVVMRADAGDHHAARIRDSMSPDVVKAIRAGMNVPLNTDPEAGSFIHYMANSKSGYDNARGNSVLESCIRTLIYWDKLRQAQTQIASRHMTPIRLVYAEDADLADVEALRDQVDIALQDPDYSIIANFEVRWEEMGSESRILDLGNEWDFISRQLYAGLGVTEGLLTGESSYSGDRISLEVINRRYMLLRELLQEFVDENLFRPMCARMGFVEEDEDGYQQVVYPRLSFTRLALRDNQDTFDAMFNMYQKGSLDVDTILEHLNIDPVSTREKLSRDKFTFNDSQFNEVMRGIYNEVGRLLAEHSDVADQVAETLGLKYEKPEEEGGRY